MQQKGVHKLHQTEKYQQISVLKSPSWQMVYNTRKWKKKTSIRISTEIYARKKKTLRIDESNYLEHQDSKISQNNQFNTFRFLLLPIHQSSNSNETIILDEGLPFKNREHEHRFVSEATVSLPNESALNNCASSNIKRSHDPTYLQHQKFPVCHYTGGTDRTSQIFGHNWPAQFLGTKTLFQLVPNSKDIVQ